jgi:leucine dehydrogenase
MKEDSEIIVTDVNGDALNAAKGMGLKVVKPDEIYDIECDIFSPCALGGVINKNTIPRIKARVVAGGANNQLLTEDDGEELHRRGILYAPDYLINAGGIINASTEIGADYNPELAREKTERIYEIMGRIAKESKEREMSTARMADRLAEERLASVRAIKPIHRGR